MTNTLYNWYNSIMTPEELKKWRKENGYLQAELAGILGVAMMTVSRWEVGIRSIPSFLHLALKAIPPKGGDKKQGVIKQRKGGK